MKLTTTTTNNNKMDLLKDAAKNINLYEVKAYVRKAQNGMYYVMWFWERRREQVASNGDGDNWSVKIMSQDADI